MPKQKRVRRSRATERFKDSDLFRADCALRDSVSRLPPQHILPHFGTKNESDGTTIDLRKEFASWKTFFCWLKELVKKHDQMAHWEAEQYKPLFIISRDLIVEAFEVATAESAYRAEVAYEICEVFRSYLPLLISAVHWDDAQFASKSIVQAVQLTYTPKEKLFDAAVAIHLGPPGQRMLGKNESSLSMTWIEALKEANRRGRFIGEKTFDKNFGTYLKEFHKAKDTYIDRIKCQIAP